MAAQFKRRGLLAHGAGQRPSDAVDTFYLGEISLQCKFALAAYGEIRTLVDDGSTNLALLAYSHMMLIFAAHSTPHIFKRLKSPH